MSNLASPAPAVEAAVADKAEYTDPAIADRVQQSEPVRISSAAAVDPALPYDDPMRYAPSIVANPKELKPKALSVEVLRGTTGADFESYAAILRGAPEKNFLQKWLPLFFDERDFVTYGEVKKYCLIKGDCCFIYGEESDPSPIYAIPLDDLYPIRENPDKPDKGSITINPMPVTNKAPAHLVTILLKYKKSHKQAYQFTFDISSKGDPSLPKRFMDVVQQCGRLSKRVTASVAVAKQVGKDAAEAQPTI